jgi:hypothetical protein
MNIFRNTGMPSPPEYLQLLDVREESDARSGDAAWNGARSWRIGFRCVYDVAP